MINLWIRKYHSCCGAVHFPFNTERPLESSLQDLHHRTCSRSLFVQSLYDVVHFRYLGLGLDAACRSLATALFYVLVDFKNPSITLIAVHPILKNYALAIIPSNILSLCLQRPKFSLGCITNFYSFSTRILPVASEKAASLRSQIP